MSDTSSRSEQGPVKPRPIILKDTVVGTQAERLVKVKREISRAAEMTRMEQLETEAQARADEILALAQTGADQILAEAKSDAESMRIKAREDGDLTAKREALEKIAGLIKSLETEVAALKEIRADFLKYNLAGIIEFACSVAKKTLVCELRTRPELIAERAGTLLERMPPGSQVTMTVAPEDLDVIERYLNEAGGPADTIHSSMKSDPSIPSGSIRLESDLGRIEARLLEELQSIGDILGDQALHQAGFRQNIPEGENGS